MNYCFGDFEFTCGGKANYIGGELLSAGLVICDDRFNVLEKFYSTMRPVENRKLHKRCIEITHLKQEEIDSSEESNKVCGEIRQLFEKYNTKKVFVWGNYDVVGIKSDANLHRRKNLNNENILALGNMIEDVQNAVTKQIGAIFNFSLSKLPEFFESTSGCAAHNSMTDAMVLFEVYKNAFGMDGNYVPLFNEFIISEKQKYKETIENRELQRKKRLSTLNPQELEYFTFLSETYGRKIEHTYFMYFRRLKSMFKKNKGYDVIVYFTRFSCVIETIKGTDIHERIKDIRDFMSYKIYPKKNIPMAMRDIMENVIENNPEIREKVLVNV